MLHHHILTRLTSTGADQHPWSLLILAALDGPQALADYLGGSRAITPPAKPRGKAKAKSADTSAVEPPGVYLGAITVSGFRGIGPATTLPLHPGPGLTLVVGRNGSGKSSFAEGAEVLLTGTSLRWEGRTRAWKLGWRNLHQADSASVSAELVVEGDGPLTATRTWPAGAELGTGEAVTRAKGGKPRPLEAHGWARHLATFRPFLSYNEMGSLLEDGPSALYDALSTVLGLEEFVAVQARLADARKEREQQVKACKAAAVTLAQSAEQVGNATGEPRAVQLAARLKAKTWELPALRALADGGTDVTREVIDGLKRLAALTSPKVEVVQEAVNRLRQSATALAALSGTDAARSLARAKLLEQALAFHEKHLSMGQSHRTGQSLQSPSPCPVCGAPDGLGADWKARSLQEVEALNAEASAVRAAQQEVEAAKRAAHALVRESGVLPSPAAGELPSLQSLREAEAMWLSARGVDKPSALADHLEAHALDLAEASTRVAAEAVAELARREDVWRPLGQGLVLWLPHAEQFAAARDHVDQLKEAEEWWKAASEEIRDERFQPIRDRAIATWQQLRLQSNVDLGGVELEGTSTRRKVALKVTVDGKDAEALGVMSQGELHSLALSLFLPRATLPDSPFRFICVDDPVQSMDPARVEGLARVLADTAKTRQVVVFTHDDRLPEAVRRLGLPARVLKVTRRADSVVEVLEARDPVSGYLDDARALAKTTEMPASVRARVVPGHCRMALEAACMTAVRQRRFRAGARHAEVEDLLSAHPKLYPLMALAMFDEAERTGDVLPRLHKMNPLAADAFKGCNLGAHEAFDGDVEGLVRDTEKLADAVVRMGAK
jgi:hypothetical protein